MASLNDLQKKLGDWFNSGVSQARDFATRPIIPTNNAPYQALKGASDASNRFVNYLASPDRFSGVQRFLDAPIKSVGMPLIGQPFEAAAISFMSPRQRASYKPVALNPGGLRSQLLDVGRGGVNAGLTALGMGTPQGLATLAGLTGVTAGLNTVNPFGDTFLKPFEAGKKSLKDIPTNITRAGLYSLTNPLATSIAGKIGLQALPAAAPALGRFGNYLGRNTITGLGNIGEDLITEALGVDMKPKDKADLINKRLGAFLTPFAIEGGVEVGRKVTKEGLNAARGMKGILKDQSGAINFGAEVGRGNPQKPVLESLARVNRNYGDFASRVSELSARPDVTGELADVNGDEGLRNLYKVVKEAQKSELTGKPTYKLQANMTPQERLQAALEASKKSSEGTLYQTSGAETSGKFQDLKDFKEYLASRDPLKQKLAASILDKYSGDPKFEPYRGRIGFQGQEQIPNKIPIGNSTSEYNVGRIKGNKKVIEQAINEVAPQFEQAVGGPISHKEILRAAELANSDIVKSIGREQTVELGAAQLRLRQNIAKLADEGSVTLELLDALNKDAEFARSTAQLLGQRGIDATPSTTQGRIKLQLLQTLERTGVAAEELYAKAQGVDFNNPESVTSFYRQFVKPTLSDWNDQLRYSSMLSSPNTHINNAFSNFQGTGIVAPIEKTITGGVDWLASTVTGKPRKYFAGEGIEYAKGYYSHISDAARRFSDVMRGKSTSDMSFDAFNAPLVGKESKLRPLADTLSFTTKLLQASDEFFQTLTQAGSTRALEYRASKGVDVKDIANTAFLEGRKRLFNAEYNLKEEGPVLKALEWLPQKVGEARRSDNPIVSFMSKFTFPFVRIPSNILKQSVEYSPAGFSTLWGASNKEEQLTKAIMGTAIGIGTSMLVSSDRITWAEPTGEKQKQAFRAAGMQPYSIKIGNTWFSYAKLHPVLAFNMALSAALKDSYDRKSINDDQLETALTGLAKWVNFFADQSYVKNIGDFVSAAKGDTEGITRYISNYPQQEIPFRALLGWVTRIVDPYQRKADPDGSILDKQLQQIATQIPGLSQNVPARLGPDGKPIRQPHRFINALSPVKISTEKQDGDIYKGLLKQSINTKNEGIIRERVLKTGKEETINGKLFYPAKVIDKNTGGEKVVIKSLKVSEPTSGEVYKNLPKEYETSSDSPKNILEKVGVYGTGLFKDPQGTLTAISNGQPIRKVSGDAVVVERLKNLSSMDNGDKTTEVDHIIPISLGGDNSEKNLQIIPKQDNRAKGVVDTYLSNLLKAGKISKKEAQQRDMNWRNEIANLPAKERAIALKLLNTPVALTPSDKTTDVSTGLGKYTLTNKTTGTKTIVDLSEPIQRPNFTGLKELDSGLVSKYNSAINKRVNDIQKVYLDGQLNASEANDAITQLKGMLIKKPKKGGAGKKIKGLSTKSSYIKTSFKPYSSKIKFSTMKTPKLPTLKVGNIKPGKLQLASAKYKNKPVKMKFTNTLASKLTRLA